ncbi:MAG: CHAT domain-containing protein, partial [Cyanobacteria bacterium P01_H01_bin.130]
PMARDIPPELQGEDGLERIDSEVLDRLPGDGEEPRTLVRAIAGAEGDFDESLSAPGDNVTDGYGFEEGGDPSGLDGGRFEGGRFEGLAPEDNVLALDGPALEGLGAEEFDGPGGLDPGGFDPEGLSAEGFDGPGDFDSEGLGAGEFDGPDDFDPEGLGPGEFDGPDSFDPEGLGAEEFDGPDGFDPEGLGPGEFDGPEGIESDELADRPFGPEGEWDGEGPPRDEGAIALQNSNIGQNQLYALNQSDWQLGAESSSAFGLGEFDSGIDFVEQAWDRQFDGHGLDQTAVGTLSTGSIRDNLTVIADQTGERSALVYIMLQPTGLETVMVGPEGSPIFRRVRGINRETVLRTAFQFREAITNPVLRRSTAYKRSAQQLYGWIIEPLREELKAQNISTLLFAPDAGLRSLPFAALHDGEEFLIEQFSIGVTPSINLTNTDYVDLRAAPVLAMGASEFTGGLSPLPAVPLELASIATSERPSQVLLNDEFTVDQLRTLRDRNPTPILHLATHGEFQTGALDNSFIQFWGDERLTLDRLRDLQLNNPPVELLILSACRTAVGDPNAELGFAGVSVHAGVKSTLASVWYVADAGTLALMNQFYEALGDAPTKSQSLRQAQLALLRGEVRLEAGVLSTRGQRSINLPDASIQAFGDTTDLSHPYYWSGFTIIGSPW